MNELQSEFLFEMSVAVDEALHIGPTPMGRRHVVSVREGTFEGPRLQGRVLSASGGDWLTTRSDESVQLDARLVLETDDEEQILMSYRGIRHGPREVIEKLAKGEEVDPSEYYFRAAPFFETASEKYGWLNRIVSVAKGRRFPDVVTYRVFEIL